MIPKPWNWQNLQKKYFICDHMWYFSSDTLMQKWRICNKQRYIYYSERERSWVKKSPATKKYKSKKYIARKKSCLFSITQSRLLSWKLQGDRLKGVNTEKADSLLPLKNNEVLGLKLCLQFLEPKLFKDYWRLNARILEWLSTTYKLKLRNYFQNMSDFLKGTPDKY